MARNNNRGGSSSRNNNPSGRNQYSSGGVMDLARERPVAAAAVGIGAAAAGLLLWSKRSQISNQLTNLSDQIGEWSENMSSSGMFSGGTGDDTGGFAAGSSVTSGTSNRNRGQSETGGGNANLGASSGGGGTTGTASGRGRAKSTATTQQ